MRTENAAVMDLEVNKRMKNAAVTDMEALPEECIAIAIGKTTPGDACRLSLVSRHFKSAADSDAVWDKFLPAVTKEILLHPESATDAKSKKELYLSLSYDPILIDESKMSIAVDKWSGKKCYMIAAKRLRFYGGEPGADTHYTPKFWREISLPESRFQKAVHLFDVGWFAIRGRIETHMLSPSTTYQAYLVYKLTERRGTYGLSDATVATAVDARAYGFEYADFKEIAAGIKLNAVLVRERELERELAREEKIKYAKFPNERKMDGWMELELGEFHCQENEDDELEMICYKIESCTYMKGLVVQGIEIRPERSY